MPNFTNEITPRANTRAEIGAPHLTQDQINYLNNENHRRDMIAALGFDMGPDWSNPIPRTGYAPRLMLLQTDANGDDRTVSFDNAGIKLGSADFWRQVQLGNVVAYPAGKSYPVQLQLKEKEGNYTVEYSKPITAETCPEPPAKKPNIFKRFFGLFGAFKKENQAWNKRVANKGNMVHKLDSLKEQREMNNNLASEEENGRRVLEDYDNQIELDKAVQAKTHIERSTDLMNSIFHPQPTMKTEPGYLASKEKPAALYHKEDFDKLKVYPKEGKDGIDLDKIQIGNSGETVSPTDFSAVTFYALWDPAICKEARSAWGGMTPQAEESVLNYPDPLDPSRKLIDPEDLGTALHGQVRNWWTGDLFLDPPREGEGRFFEKTTNAGRQIAVDAFKDYAAGKNEKLAKIIATGLNSAAKDFGVIDGSLSVQNLGIMKTSDQLLKFMDKDPALKAEVMKQGLDPERLKVVQGSAKLLKLEQEARDAEEAMMRAKRERRELSQEEKLQYTKAMLKARIPVIQMTAQNNQYNDAEDRMIMQATLVEQASTMRKSDGTKINKQDLDAYKKDPSKAPKLKPGEMFLDTAGDVAKNLSKLFNPDVKALKDLSEEKGMAQLDKMAENIIKVEGLANKSADWLFKELNHAQHKPTLNLADSIIKVGKNIFNLVDQNAPVQNQPQKQMGKLNNDRMKMFEKKPEGPNAGA